MCNPAALAIAGAVLAAGGQVYSGLSANAASKYERNVAQENRRHELKSADDARDRGAIEQMRHYRKLAYQLGEQRAQQAASGVDISFGSALDLQTDAALIGQEDSAIIAENTRREVEGYEINAANYTMQGRAARSRGNAALVGGFIGAGSTLLSAASQVSRMKTDTK